MPIELKIVDPPQPIAAKKRRAGNVEPAATGRRPSPSNGGCWLCLGEHTGPDLSTGFANPARPPTIALRVGGIARSHFRRA
jgi:hypothetical protein